MNNKDQPAFPVFPDTESGHGSVFRGMTLRDYFAAKAMQGLLAGTVTRDTVWCFDEAAETSYNMADAMIKARVETE